LETISATIAFVALALPPWVSPQQIGLILFFYPRRKVAQTVTEPKQYKIIHFKA
jgi:hypothetical protein